MINHQELIEYFESLATNHADIAHQAGVHEKNAFLYGDVEMLLEDISGTNSSGYMMLFECGSGKLDGPDEVNLYDRAEVAFVICKSVLEGDRLQQREVEHNCKTIGLQVMKRIQKDRNDETPEWLMDFDLNDVNYMRVYGFGNNHFGVRFQFSIVDSAQLNYDENKWLDTPTP
jgi:hypothetical protein